MSNAQFNYPLPTMGEGPTYIFDLPVAASAHIYRGTLISQLTASGNVVPYSTALSSRVVGVAQFEIDNSSGSAGDKRLRIETKRMYAMKNGTSGDAFSESSIIGDVVYGSDDHTVAKVSTGGRKPVGFFFGMEADGKVRVFVDPTVAALVEKLMLLTDSPATADALRDNIVASFG